MSMQVHWHEGLFLQPQHLQLSQRFGLEAAWSERKLSWSYPYGVIEQRLSTDDLANMRVRFDRLRVVMPGGVVVESPDSADLPALDIKKPFESTPSGLTIALGVPLYYAQRANAMEPGQDTDWRIKRLFRVAEIERHDENSGENAQPVRVRRINARLIIVGQDDASDLEVVPLVRVVRATGEESGLPRVDTGFIPPCLVITGSPILRDMLRDLANQVEANRRELIVQMTRGGGFNLETLRGLQWEQIWRLRTLGRFAARLGPLSMAPGGVPPFQMYLELREMLGELSALRPDADQYSSVKYDHDNPAIAFVELITRIRGMLKSDGATGTWGKVQFKKEEGVLVAALGPEVLGKANEFFVGVKSGEDPRGLARLVEDGDEFKMMARSMVHHRIRGVKLAEERHPPLQLPSQVGLHYFRLERAESARMWDRIVAEKAIAIKYPGMESRTFDDVSLYYTIPSGGADDR